MPPTAGQRRTMRGSGTSRDEPESRSGRPRITPPRDSQSKLTSTGSEAAESAAEVTPAEEATRDALYQRAALLGINGRSRMTKDGLRRAIAAHEHGRR